MVAETVRLSLVMPVYNEAEVLPATLERLRALALPVPWELIVVDDGSTDGGVEGMDDGSVPSAERVRVLRHSKNRGKGAAIRTGFSAADGDILGVQDADLEYDPADIPQLLAPLLDGRADAVFGARTQGRYVPYSPWYALGNRFLGLVAGMMFGRRVGDLYTGYKFMTRRAYERLHLTADGFDIEAEIGSRLFLTMARVLELPVSYAARSRAAGKKLRARDGLHGLARLIRVRIGC
jgi:glycosyltransferase involved in cell wall biosynthesis